MELILFFLILGFVIGHFRLLPTGTKITQQVMVFGLIFLLLVMGAQLGANKKVLADFGRMGMQAVALAAGGVIFSVLFVRMVEGFIRRGIDSDEYNIKTVSQEEKVGEEG
ncbi:MAG: LysO family transporter [Desulfotomaculum sp.]|nr:LysO family transporter [Desulfotomaculum sp.]